MLLAEQFVCCGADKGIKDEEETSVRFRTYSHRFADAIIEHDEQLNRRYNEFVGALASITDEELIADFEQRRDAHLRRNSNFKSMTPSINAILKAKIQ